MINFRCFNPALLGSQLLFFRWRENPKKNASCSFTLEHEHPLMLTYLIFDGCRSRPRIADDDPLGGSGFSHSSRQRPPRFRLHGLFQDREVLAMQIILPLSPRRSFRMESRDLQSHNGTNCSRKCGMYSWCAECPKLRHSHTPYPPPSPSLLKKNRNMIIS